MNLYIKQLVEVFDFNSVKKQNKNINAVDAALQYIIHKIDKREKLSKDEYSILKKSVGIYKVYEHDELQELIKYFTGQFGDECTLNWIDVSNVTDMNNMFFWSTFNGDISQWDVSKVTNMYCMFYYSNFNSDISQWDVGNVTNMSYMFYNSEFNSDISQWDVSNVTNRRNMLNRCPIKSKYKPKFK